jgi:hypothetical protein
VVAALALAVCPVAGAKAKSKPKLLVYRGAVVHFDSASITLRDPKNPLMLHTFSYSLALREKVAKLLETGGYEYGQIVRIRYAPGSSVALAILGKPKKKAPKPAIILKGKHK